MSTSSPSTSVSDMFLSEPHDWLKQYHHTQISDTITSDIERLKLENARLKSNIVSLEERVNRMQCTLDQIHLTSLRHVDTSNTSDRVVAKSLELQEIESISQRSREQLKRLASFGILKNTKQNKNE